MITCFIASSGTSSRKKQFAKHSLNGLPLAGNFRVAVDKAHAFSWINENRVNLLNFGFEVSQPDNQDKNILSVKAVIELEVKLTGLIFMPRSDSVNLKFRLRSFAS